MKRAERRKAGMAKRIAAQRSLAKRTKGLWLWDDDECFRCVYKRNDREQKGRLRLLKGALPAVAARIKADSQRNLLADD